MATVNRERTTNDAPRPRRRNMRTLRANRMKYLMANYRLQHLDAWEIGEVEKAMWAAYNAGRRDEKERRDG